MNKTINKIMEDWNPEDWQGKRREQYEYSAMVVFVCLIVAALVFTIATLGKFI